MSIGGSLQMMAGKVMSRTPSKCLISSAVQRRSSSKVPTIKRTTRLKQLLHSNDLEFMMEAHNGLSARIVEDVGFKSIWASGLCLSAQWGVRDANEASWTQVLDAVDFMTEGTSIPIMLDVDTGYGNFNNARRLTQKLELHGVAGACIEDKLFPKKNSFVNGRAQPLTDIEEFCLKIQAMCDTRVDPDFCIVARIEALIAGWGMDEALKRASCYVDAGADAILVHSKKDTAVEIEQFMSQWGNKAPVVIVPTKYYRTTTEQFKKIGVSLVIWANHNLRASIQAMYRVSKRILQDQSLINVESQITSVQDIFRLQNQNELLVAEEKYLPAVRHDDISSTKPTGKHA